MSNEMPAEKDVVINGLKLHYLDWGNEGKQDMLLLHGLGSHGHSWDYFARALKDKYRILALDQRGHGDSEWAKDGYLTANFASDVVGFVNKLGLDKFVLVGLSLGGRNAMAYASEHANKLDKLVIVDIGPVINTQGSARIRHGQANAPTEFATEEELLAHGMARFPRHSREMAGHRMKYATRKREDGKFEWKFDRQGLEIREQLVAEDPWTPLTRITCPTLLVRGTESDVLARDVALRMVETIPNCKFAEVSSGHSIPGDNPVDFEKAVRGFLGV